jgi:hypothetical protein
VRCEALCYVPVLLAVSRSASVLLQHKRAECSCVAVTDGRCETTCALRMYLWACTADSRSSACALPSVHEACDASRIAIAGRGDCPALVTWAECVCTGVCLVVVVVWGSRDRDVCLPCLKDGLALHTARVWPLIHSCTDYSDGRVVIDMVPQARRKVCRNMNTIVVGSAPRPALRALDSDIYTRIFCGYI